LNSPPPLFSFISPSPNFWGIIQQVSFFHLHICVHSIYTICTLLCPKRNFLNPFSLLASTQSLVLHKKTPGMICMSSFLSFCLCILCWVESMWGRPLVVCL
jgi:hypothetical protein